MNILCRLKLRSKLALLLGLFAFGLVAAVTVDAMRLHQHMLADRVNKLKAATDMTIGLATSLQRQVAAHQMTQEQALARLRDLAHPMRFDGGDGYLTVQTLDGMVLVHAGDPSREGKPGSAKAADGRSIMQLVRETLGNSDSGSVSYLFPKPGQTKPQPKISYVARFAPLNAVFFVGAYTDDLDRAFRAQMMTSALLGGSILLVTLVVAWLVDRDLVHSLNRLKGSMAALAHGELATDIPGTDRHDEVGEMAAAVQVFKENAIKMDRLKADHEAAEKRAADEKQRAMTQLAGEFESNVGAIVETVASSATELQTTAASMTATAEETSRQVTAVAAASEQALTNVQSVAGAAEELSGSVAEISRQVASSSAIAAKAVSESERTSALVNGLTEAAQKIGAVTAMISAIASQTNLLALNATIEAARAGDAGKGFAVVASEVKNLANQTAKATEEISQHIAEMQNATGNTVSAVQLIGTTISQINEIATTIAAAVEEQGAATREIARNIQQVTAGTQEVTHTISDVSRGASETGKAATRMLDAAEKLSAQAERLTGESAKFIAGVKAA